MEKKEKRNLEEVLSDINSTRTSSEKFKLAEAPKESTAELAFVGEPIRITGAEEEKEELHVEEISSVTQGRSIPSGKSYAGKKKSKMSGKERGLIAVGILITLFAVVGFVTTVRVSYGLVKDITEQRAQKEELAEEILPLVIVDVPEFTDAKNLDNSAIIASSVWALITDDNDKSKYPKDDLGAMYVPDVDVEVYLRRLFGDEVPIKHQTVDNSSLQIIYDPELKTYIIDSTPTTLPYTPRVDKIGKEDGVYTLRVSYLLPDAIWSRNSEQTATVDKIMEYRLARTEDSYQILSVKVLEVTGVNKEDQVTPDPFGFGDEDEDLSSEEETSSGEEETSSGESSSEESDTTSK